MRLIRLLRRIVEGACEAYREMVVLIAVGHLCCSTQYRGLALQWYIMRAWDLPLSLIFFQCNNVASPCIIVSRVMTFEQGL
jgi:hypothetical protein